MPGVVVDGSPDRTGHYPADVPRPLLDLAARWHAAADRLAFPGDEYDSRDDEERDALADVYRECATAVEVSLGAVDTAGGASRQHFIETGRYLRFAELDDDVEGSLTAPYACAECGTTEAHTYVVTTLDRGDARTRTEVCRACDDALRGADKGQS